MDRYDFAVEVTCRLALGIRWSRIIRRGMRRAWWARPRGAPARLARRTERVSRFAAVTLQAGPQGHQRCAPSRRHDGQRRACCRAL